MASIFAYTPATTRLWLMLSYGRLYAVLGGTPDNTVNLYSSRVISDNRWHQVALEVDPGQSKVRLVVDGQFDTQASPMTPSRCGTVVDGELEYTCGTLFLFDPASSQSFVIGDSKDSCNLTSLGAAAPALIDDLAIYKIVEGTVAVPGTPAVPAAATPTIAVVPTATATATATSIPAITPTPVPPPVNGSCGTAAKKYDSAVTAYTGTFCVSGTVSPSSPAFPVQGSYSSWSCVGLNGGTTATCTASRTFPPQNGSCGSAAKAYARPMSYSAVRSARSALPRPHHPHFRLRMEPPAGSAVD